MANGGYWRSQAEWQRAEEPLLQLDSSLIEFATEFGLQVTKNHKDWPERSIAWGGQIRLLIQIHLANPDDLTLTLWLCASRDRGGKRFWKQESPIQGKPVAEFQSSFPSLLRESREKLEAWSETDLEFVTDVALS